jgi:hypothetical protein
MTKAVEPMPLSEAIQFLHGTLLSGREDYRDDRRTRAALALAPMAAAFAALGADESAGYDAELDALAALLGEALTSADIGHGEQATRRAANFLIAAGVGTPGFRFTPAPA